MEIASPVNGERVGEVAVLRGRRRGPWDPDRQHLWLLAGPRQGAANLWVHPEEIVPADDGAWESRPYIGGEPGVFHRLVVGVVDEAGHELISGHIANRASEPFEGGPPPGFIQLVEISVEKTR